MAGVARGTLLVGVQLGLHPGEGLLTHDRRDRHRDPVLGRAWGVAVARADRQQRRLAPAGRDHPGAVGLRPARIGGIAQDAAHAGGVPARLARRGRNAKVGQALGEPVHGRLRLQIPVEQLCHQHRRIRLHPHPCRIPGAFRVQPVTERRRGPGQQRARPQLGLAPAAHPLGDQRALVLSHRPTDLQQQLIVRILAHRPVQKLDLAAVPAQLVDEQHLVDIVAGQPVGRGDHHQVNLGQRRVIPQAVQARPAQAGAAVAVIAIHVPLIQRPAPLGDRRHQPVKLLLDGLGLGLAGRRNPRVHRDTHQAPPVPSAPPAGCRRLARLSSAPATGRPDPNDGRRRGGG